MVRVETDFNKRFLKKYSRQIIKVYEIKLEDSITVMSTKLHPGSETDEVVVKDWEQCSITFEKVNVLLNGLITLKLIMWRKDLREIASVFVLKLVIFILMSCNLL